MAASLYCAGMVSDQAFLGFLGKVEMPQETRLPLGVPLVEGLGFLEAELEICNGLVGIGKAGGFWKILRCLRFCVS